MLTGPYKINDANKNNDHKKKYDAQEKKKKNTNFR